MIGGLQSRDIADRLPVGGGYDVLHGGSNVKVPVAVEKVANIAQAVTSPAAARGAGIATDRKVRVAGGNGLRVMKVRGSAACRDIKTPEWLRDVDASAERNHELVIAALDGSDVCDFGILVVRGAES